MKDRGSAFFTYTYTKEAPWDLKLDPYHNEDGSDNHQYNYDATLYKPK
jgi:hypothetical protein